MRRKRQHSRSKIVTGYYMPAPKPSVIDIASTAINNVVNAFTENSQNKNIPSAKTIVHATPLSHINKPKTVAGIPIGNNIITEIKSAHTSTQQPIVTEQPIAQTIPVTQPKPAIVTPPTPIVKHPSIRTKFHSNTNGLSVTGASVRGSSHIQSNDPCQDYCAYEDYGNGWYIAVTSDGAGSCKKSQHGSKSNCVKALKFFKEIFENYGWFEHNYTPSELEWQMEATHVFTRIYKDACKYAKAKKFNPSELSATIIVNVITPNALLVAHIGDGRAGYLNGKNEWVASITPHKGEESNQTVFLHSNAHTNPGFKMSGVYVPECKVIVDDIKAFTLMSDGGEKSTWLCSTFENEQFNDPNKPHAPFFNNIIEHLKNTNTPEQDIADILIGGTAAFKKETDDKTIIIGYKNECKSTHSK